MASRQDLSPSITENCQQFKLNHKLAAYLAATASGSLLAAEAQAVVVSNSTVRPFGINGEVNIDFNNDTQIDFQIDHDRVNLNGTNIDYLQIDKNDINGAANPYPIDPLAVFPVPTGQTKNWDHGYMTSPELPNDVGYYPAALLAGQEIGPAATWDFQEGDDFTGQHTTIRANRLIDEDMTQIDAANPSPPAGSLGQQLPFGAPGWVGLGGQTGYLGVRIDLNDAGFTGNTFPSVNGPNNTDDDANYWYGWVGLRITNEADATGEVVGYGYETQRGVAITAGATAPAVAGDYNANGTVDAADYTIWRDHLGLTGGATAAQGDGTGDGNVTQADYDFWKSHFAGAGSGSLATGSGTAAVPEPSSLLLGLGMSLAMIGTFLYRKFRS